MGNPCRYCTVVQSSMYLYQFFSHSHYTTLSLSQPSEAGGNIFALPVGYMLPEENSFIESSPLLAVTLFDCMVGFWHSLLLGFFL